MTAKVRKPASPAQFSAPGQPGSIMGTLQQEVADEASPMLIFLARYAKVIALCIVLFIAAIGGYWFYASHAEQKRGDEALALGKILLISDGKMRLERLEAFAKDAPASVKREAWFAIMEAANQLKDYDKVYAAWKSLGDLDKSIRVTAAVGMADALSAQEKFKEALSLLEGVSASLTAAESSPVNSRILLLAENLGDYGRAMLACDALLARAGSQTEMSMWTQKKAVLEQKAAANATRQ